MNRRTLLKGLVGVTGVALVGREINTVAAEEPALEIVWAERQVGRLNPIQGRGVYRIMEHADITWNDGIRILVNRPAGVFAHRNSWLCAPNTFVIDESVPFGPDDVKEYDGRYVPRRAERFEQVMAWYAAGAPPIRNLPMVN